MTRPLTGVLLWTFQGFTHPVKPLSSFETKICITVLQDFNEKLEVVYIHINKLRTFGSKLVEKTSPKCPEPFTKPPLLQESRLTGGGSPKMVDLVERKVPVES